MDDQASVRTQNGARANGVLGSLSDFGNDVASLAELQFKLTALDAKVTAERAKVPLVAAVAGLILLLGSLPVLLLGAAALLATALEIAPGWAMLIVGGLAFGLSAAVLAIAGQRLGGSLAGFERSRDELVRNLSWIRTVLLYSGRPASK